MSRPPTFPPSLLPGTWWQGGSGPVQIVSVQPGELSGRKYLDLRCAAGHEFHRRANVLNGDLEKRLKFLCCMACIEDELEDEAA